MTDYEERVVLLCAKLRKAVLRKSKPHLEDRVQNVVVLMLQDRDLNRLTDEELLEHGWRLYRSPRSGPGRCA